MSDETTDPCAPFVCPETTTACPPSPTPPWYTGLEDGTPPWERTLISICEPDGATDDDDESLPGGDGDD